MKVTVCQLHDYAADDARLFLNDWQRLLDHARGHRSELLVLPEMPFYPWLFDQRHYDNDAWQAALRAHDTWETQLSAAAPAIVCATRPVEFGNERYHEGFVWDREHHLRGVHVKARIPHEEHAWEAAWYTQPMPEFEPLAVDGFNTPSVSLGFLIGDEIADREQAELYGLDGVQLLIAPRSTGAARWHVEAQHAARAARAFCLSSNRCGAPFGGAGCIIAPSGDLLAITTDQTPFITLDVDVESVKAIQCARRTQAMASVPPIE